MGIVYLTNDTGVAVSSGNTIPMTTIKRRKNSCIGTSMEIKSGWYKVDINAVLTSTAGGNATITLYNNDTAVQSTSATIAAAGTVTIPLSAVVRTCCCGSKLTIVYTGVALTATTAEVIIENV